MVDIYFAAAILNNSLLVAGTLAAKAVGCIELESQMAGSPMESAWAVYWILTGLVGMLGGSIGTITILHVTVMKRLQAMGRGRGLGVVIVIEAVCPLLIYCGVLFVPLTLLLQQLVFQP